MKRLVAYDSSDDEEEPAIKKKRLPSLSASLTVPVPVDNPALHQGRVRTTPHVDGQWACHVYLCIKLEKSALSKLVTEVVAFSRDRVPSLVAFENELHVSLSRPVFLRAHQRDDLKRAVKACAQKCQSFTLSFARFSELTNDEKTRTFLAMEVGAGHNELKSLSDMLTPTLQIFRQKEYYTEPRFHASIAWDLSQFPEDLVPVVNESFSQRLSLKSVGWFEAESISLKIGKDVFSWGF